MSDSEDIQRAIALSLLDHSDDVKEEEDELKMAIAASLGKTASQLTARDLLMADYDSHKPAQKRSAIDLTTTASNNKRQKTPTRFWDGTVKLTYIKGFHGPDYITLAEIIHKVLAKIGRVFTYILMNFPPIK
jgi:tyrosyl-DNA phosphodiesterase-1